MNAEAVVTGFATIADVVLAWLGQALFFGTIVAGLTWLLLRALRGRTSPAFAAAVWSVVLIKFLVPFGPGWSLSLASAWNRIAAEASVGLAPAETIDVPVENPSVTAIASKAEQQPKTGTLTSHWPTVAVLSYVLGVAGLGMVRWRGYRAFRAGCRALPTAEPGAAELVRCVCERLGVRRIPRVHLTDEPRVAFVLGITRPLLVISRSYFVRPDEVETVIVHEVTHLRRGDMLVRCLQCAAGTLLFFWPVVAWVNRRIDRAREHACDEWALRHGRLTASEYARCLLSAVRPARSHRLTYHPACMAGNPSTIERRIDVILELPSRPGRRPVWGLLAVAIFAAWSGFTLTGVAQAGDPVKGGKGGESKYAATKEDMTRHAQVVYARVNELDGGDQDGDGQVSKEECWTYLTAALLMTPDATLKRYPQADHDGDGQLDLTEVYLLVRGDDDVKRGEKKTQSAIEEAKQAGDKERAKQIEADSLAKGVMIWHKILDRREQMLDEMSDLPSTDMVKKVAAKIEKLETEWAAENKSGKLDYAIGQIYELKAKVAELRERAAELNGDEAKAYLDKANQIEEKAAQLKEQTVTYLEQVIAKLEAEGQQEKAEQLAAKLAELKAD